MAEANLFDRVMPIDIEKEVKRSFLEYSMSVIVSRALPDVRDGLKPVHRRILYGLYDMGMTHEKAHKKSAHIVGEVMGKYHPHGDSAIYDTMVKMAQDFSMRYPLIDGHGNFGSVDGDSAAAMRYTESRMARISQELLRDLDKDTVEWRPNYDESRQEPQVLPARIPNLLINGSAGIAVGMATNIPPHNLGEIIDGLEMLIKDPEVSINELMEAIPGPDFPTAGIIRGTEGIHQAYHTGRGRVRMRARHTIQELKNGRNAIIVTQLPYQVNKARLVGKIAELVREKKIEGIVDLRDESNRDGMRIVIEVRKDINVNVVVNKLFRHTQMEDSFGVIMLGLVNGQPRVFNLKEMLEEYLKHRQDVLTRRTRYELRVALDRLHIVEGLQIAIDHLDEVLNLIRSSKDREAARTGLMAQFSLSERQANAILDMRFAQLTGLERTRLQEEHQELLAKIADYEDILADPQRILGMIQADLQEVKKAYGDERRTEISLEESDFNIEDLIEDHDVVVTLSNRGYIKRHPLETYRSQRRGGRGISSTTIRAEDAAHDVLVTSVLSQVLFFTNQGRVFTIKAYRLPESSRQAKGMPVVNFLELRPGERVSTMVAARDMDADKNLIMLTKKGVIKKTPLSAFSNIRRNGLIAVNLREGDELVGVQRVEKEDKIMIASSSGHAIMFDESEVRAMGRTAAGVRAIRLGPDEYVVGIDKYRAGAWVLLVTEKGYGKRTEVDEFKQQGRGGKGLKSMTITKKNGKLVAFRTVRDGEEMVLLTEEGQLIRLQIDDISVQKRYSRGVLLMKLPEDDHIVGLAKFKVEKEE